MRKKLKQTCEHKDCKRRAVCVVSSEKPRHTEFQGQQHYCCSYHSRQYTPATKAA